jgi:hypothetical protein
MTDTTKWKFIELVASPPDRDFNKTHLQDGLDHLDGKLIRLDGYQAIYNNCNAMEQQWLMENLPPWTFSRIIELMDMQGQPLPAFNLMPFSGGGEYRQIGRIVISSYLTATMRVFKTHLDTLLSIFVHELQHHKQYLEKRLYDEKIDGKWYTCWEGSVNLHSRDMYNLSSHQYSNLPWEKEANITAYKVLTTLIEEGHVKHHFIPEETIFEYYERTRGCFEEKAVEPRWTTEESYPLSNVS